MVRFGFMMLLPVLLGGCGGDDLHPFFRSGARPFLFAHRGGGGLMPEATLPAFVEAQRRDPQAIVEFDVHQSRDGELVVIHDDRVDRTTDGRGRVRDMTLDELRLLDAGHCASPGVGDGTAEGAACADPSAPPESFPFRSLGYRIPTLQEVFAALPQETRLSIEVKASGFERVFAQALIDSGRIGRVVVGSEDDDVAVRLKDLLPEVPHFLPRAAATCFAVGAKSGLDYAGCPTYQAFASPRSSAGLALDTRGILSAAHDRGMVVIYWTINDEPEMERLLRLGADGVFTDYPDRARAVIDRLAAEGLW